MSSRVDTLFGSWYLKYKFRVIGGPKGPSPEYWHSSPLLKVIKLSLLHYYYSYYIYIIEKNQGLRLAYTLVLFNKFVAWYAVLGFVYTILIQYYGSCIMPFSINGWGSQPNIIIKPTTCLANLRF